MQHCTTRWAVHKAGTAQLGYLCSSKSIAESMLEDIRSSSALSSESKAKYNVIEVQVTWSE